MLTLIPLMVGVVVENRRLSSDWAEMLIKVLWAFLFSLIVFFPSLGEDDYDLQVNLEFWPYFFIFFFVLLSTIWHEHKIIPQLTEGVTLVQSISIIYWVVDLGYSSSTHLIDYVLLSIGCALCAGSFIHAMTNFELNKIARMILSIWSSLVMVVFGLDHIYRVFSMEYTFDPSIVTVAMEYFLLGVSLAFIFQNVLMLLTYLPGKGRYYNALHMEEIRKMNKVHIDRYSRDQIKFQSTILLILVTSALYYLNYIYQWFPANNLIWLVFWLFPYVINEKDYSPE